MGCQKLHISKSNYTFKKVVRGGLFKEEKTCAEEYRFGFNGQEKDNEISGEGNSYTAEFWQYDSRLGRRWNQDPKPNSAYSPYSCFANNPIIFTDVKGDTLTGVSQLSATRLQTEIQNSFLGDNAKGFRDLIKIADDGLAIAPISVKDFKSATKGMDKDQKALATAYFGAINSTSVHSVDMVKRSENLSQMSLDAISTLGEGWKKGIQDQGYISGQQFDDAKGVGGGLTAIGKTSSLSIIVMDSKSTLKDIVNNTISTYINNYNPTAGGLLAHEVLGHGFAYVMGYPDYAHNTSIQMENLYFRAMRFNYYRDGSGHGDGKLDKGEANKIPFAY